MKVTRRNIFSRIAILALVVLLILGFTTTGAYAMAGTPDSLVDVYYAFNGANFVRSATPMDLTVGGGSVSQTVNPGGSITVSLTDIVGYADIGFGVDAGPLGDLNGILVKGTGDHFGLNMYFDKDGDGEYFTWSGDTYTGTGSDSYILSAGSSTGVMEVTNSTLFTSMNPGGGNYTLAQLKAGAAAGITGATNVRLWIGACCDGTVNSTINYININSGPITDYYVDDDYSAGNAGEHIFGVDAFAHIQEAVNAAGTGANIHVAAGTYAEQVIVNKSVHLLGAGIGTSIISAPSTLPTSGNPTSAIVLISGSGVDAELTGFTVSGPGPSTCGTIRAGIYVYDTANANIHHNAILDIRDNPISGCQNGVAIAVGRQAWSTTGTAIIDHNTISGYQKGGIVVDNAGSSAIITNNTLTGAGTVDFIAQNGIQISRGANATLSGNNVTGNSYHRDSDLDSNWGSTGVLLYQAGNVTLAGGNNISNNDQNFYIFNTAAVNVGAEFIGPSSAPAGIGYNVVNYTNLPLDLTSVTFLGTTNNFEIEDSIWHGVDDPTLGLVTWVAGNLFVTPSSGSIQAAIDLATAGNTVNVAPGTYDEQVIIDKGLTLNGSGDTTIIQPTQTTADGFSLYNRKFGGPLNTAGIIVTNTTASVTVSNLKVDGSLVTSVPAGANGFTGILYRGNPGLIDNVTVVNIHDAGVAAGLGIFLSGFDTPVSMTVSDSTITGYGKNGITASYATLDASLTGNTITGMGPTITIAQNGIQLGYGATGTITNNTISDHAWTGTYGGSNDPATDEDADGATGILLFMAGADIEIGNNTLTNNQFGIWSVATTSVDIHDNTIGGLAHTGIVYPVAIAVWSEDMWVAGLEGDETATSATIENNTISTNDYGVLVRDYRVGGPFPSAILSGNDFSTNDTHVLATGDSVFDASLTLTGNTFDRYAMVDHGGTLLPAIWGKIQLAIDAAVAGDTVNIGPGTFTENVVVDKSVTLNGSGAGVSIVQPAFVGTSCASGSSICVGSSNVILVQANDVVIHDLTVDGDNPSLTGGVDIGGANVDARNGIITNHEMGVYNGLEVTNVAISNIYLRGLYASSGGSFNFHNNTVTNVKGNASSIAIFAYGGGPGIISNNTVSDANDAISANHSSGIQFLDNTVTDSASGIHTDNAGDAGGIPDLIQGNTVSDCKTDGYGIWTFVPYIAPIINDNNITNCSVGLSAWAQGAAVIPQFTNNIVTGPDKAAGSVGAYITTDLIGWGYNDVSVLFTGNVITNFETGVYLTADEQSWNPEEWTSQTVNATFHLNQIYNNTDGMSKGTTGTYINDFEKNWWGAPSGPGPVGLGLGDTISADVDYSPWCTNPGCTTFAPPIATTTTITADTPDPSLPGQIVSVTVAVGNSFGGDFVPTGTVIVFEGTEYLSTSEMGAPAIGTYCTITLVNATGSCGLTFLTSGTKTITALYSPEATADFTSSSDTETHTVDKSTPIVTIWPTASAITYGQALSASTLSGGSASTAGSFAFTTPASLPNAGTALQGVTFTPADTANYSTVTSTVSVTVNKADLNVTANNASKAYNGLPFNGGSGVVYAGFVNGETASVLGGTLGYTGDSQGAVNAGTYDIIPGGLTSGNYEITFFNGTLTVNQVALSVTAQDASKSYDGLVYSGGYSVAYQGFVNSETSADLGGSLVFGGASQTAVNAGSYPIMPSGLTSVNYAITFHNGTLTINKAAQTITFGSLEDKTLGEADFTVSATASSALTVTFTSDTPSVCTATNEGLVHLAATGICTVTAAQAGNNNFEPAANVTQSFIVKIPVNHAPVITEGSFVNVSMSVDGSPVPFDLTLHATDADSDTLTWSVIAAATNGTATVSGTGSSKVVTYVPDSGYLGSDNFEVQVSDGKGGTDTITVFVTVNPLEPPTYIYYLPIILR